jgi:hypothetical protein
MMGFSPFRPTGVTHHLRERVCPGYTLVCAVGGDAAYLVDMDGQVVHSWQPPAHWRTMYAELLDNGHLLLSCTNGGEAWQFGGRYNALVELDWDGRELWRHEDPNLHHDRLRLANGNTVVMYWEPLVPELVERIQGGIPATELRGGVMAGDCLKEISPDGRVVWEWHSSDFMDPATDVLCPLHRRNEWCHSNTVALLPDGNFLLSFNTLDTIAIVARPSGEVVWRWGRGEISHQHDANPLTNGNILLFDNGTHALLHMSRSRAVELDPRTEKIVWTYQDDPLVSFYSSHLGGVQRLSNGNTLICEGSTGRLFEVSQGGDILWEYVSPYSYVFREEQHSTAMFRAHRYEPGSPQLGGYF